MSMELWGTFIPNRVMGDLFVLFLSHPLPTVFNAYAIQQISCSLRAGKFLISTCTWSSLCFWRECVELSLVTYLFFSYENFSMKQCSYTCANNPQPSVKYPFATPNQLLIILFLKVFLFVSGSWELYLIPSRSDVYCLWFYNLLNMCTFIGSELSKFQTLGTSTSTE